MPQASPHTTRRTRRDPAVALPTETSAIGNPLVTCTTMADGGQPHTSEPASAPVGSERPDDTTLAAPPSPSQNPRFGGFDGLRAVAALLVVVTHTAFPAGFNARSDFWGPYTARLDVGVAVFFLISGFLLYRPFVYARLAPEHGQVAVGSYLWRRFLRIYPAFWVAFTFTILVLPRPDASTPSAGGLLAHYTLTHIYFEDHVLGPLQQSWTLATEVSFYLFLPLYAWCMRRLRSASIDTRYMHELMGVAVLYLVSVAFRAWIETGGLEPAGMYKTWLPARTDLFALGMFLAATSAWLQATRRPTPRWLLHRATPWISWGLALVAFHWVSKEIGLEHPDARGPISFEPSQEFSHQALYGLVGFFGLIPVVFAPVRDPVAGTAEEGGIRRFLAWRPIVWLGLVSYGIYLWHIAWIDAYLVWFDRGFFDGSSVFGWVYPLGLEAGFIELFVFVLALTIVCAAISYYLVERPAMRLRRLVPRRRVADSEPSTPASAPR